MRMILTEVLPHVAEGLTVKALFGTKDIEDLRSREDGKELVMIVLLNLLQLQLNLVAFLNKSLTAGIVGRLHTPLLPHLAEDSTLLALHLTEEREELGALIGREPRLLGDKLLHLGLELLRRELLRFIGLTDKRACQEEHHAYKDLLHFCFVIL